MKVGDWCLNVCSLSAVAVIVVVVVVVVCQDVLFPGCWRRRPRRLCSDASAVISWPGSASLTLVWTQTSTNEWKHPLKGQFWLFLRLNLVKMFLPILHLNNVNDGKDSESSFKHQYVVTYLHHISSKLCRITEENKHPKKRGISQFYIFIPRRRRSVEGVRVRPDGLTGSVCGSYRRLLVSVSVCRNSHLQSINQSINTWPVSPSGFS